MRLDLPVSCIRIYAHVEAISPGTKNCDILVGMKICDFCDSLNGDCQWLKECSFLQRDILCKEQTEG